MINTPSETEIDILLCKHWPAYSMQAVLVKMRLREAIESAIAQWATPQPSPTEQAAESVPAEGREQERTAFKDAHRHLELDEVPDAWGRPMFKHSHVEASWLGWIARASHRQAPSKTAPAAVAGPSEAVAYLDIGTGGYLDLGTDLADEALSRLPKGRHALVIAGTYGIDGYTAAPTTQPAPAAQEGKKP